MQNRQNYPPIPKTQNCVFSGGGIGASFQDLGLCWFEATLFEFGYHFGGVTHTQFFIRLLLLLGSWSPRGLVTCLARLARGLQDMHRKRWMHRDIKAGAFKKCPARVGLDCPDFSALFPIPRDKSPMVSARGRRFFADWFLRILTPRQSSVGNFHPETHCLSSKFWLLRAGHTHTPPDP